MSWQGVRTMLIPTGLWLIFAGWDMNTRNRFIGTMEQGFGELGDWLVQGFLIGELYIPFCDFGGMYIPTWLV